MSGPWWNLFGTVGAIVAAVLLFLLTYGALMLGLARVRAAGWGAGVAALLLFGCVALGTGLAWPIGERIGERLDARDLGVLATFIGFMTLGPGAFLGLSGLLPRRRRAGGPRRGGAGLVAGFYSAALLCAGALAVLGIAVWADAGRGEASALGGLGGRLLGVLGGPLAMLAAGLALAGWRVQRQRRAPGAEAVLADDPRPPVLYLRAFRDEQQPFIRGDAQTLKPYLQGAARWLPGILRPAWSDEQGVSAEAYLAAAIGRRLGPFIALGSPQDALAPLGAAREYAGDDAWQQRLTGLAAQARAIVLVPGRTDALGWELRMLRQRGHGARLFVLVGSEAFQRSSLWWVGRLYGWRNPDWPSFRALLAEAGFSAPPESPRPHSVLGFDIAGRGRWLAEDTAVEPDDYARIIEAHLQRLADPPRSAKPSIPDRSAEPPAPAAPSLLQQQIDRLAGRDGFDELRWLGAVLGFIGPLGVCINEGLGGRWMRPFGFEADAMTLAGISALAGALSFRLLARRGDRIAALLCGALAGAGAWAAGTHLSFGTGLSSEWMFLLAGLGAAPGIAAYLWWLERRPLAIAQRWRSRSGPG